jgi:RecA-family ATPase
VSDTRHRFEVLSDSDLEALPDPSCVVDDVLLAKALAILYGLPGAGKTFVALGMGLAIATDKPWCGRATAPGHVVYVVAEGVGGVAKRIRAWKQAHGVAAVPRFHVVR